MSDGFNRHTPTLAGTRAARVIVFDKSLAPFLGDAIAQLAQEYQWLEVGSPVDDITQALYTAIDTFYGSSMIGQIAAFLGAIPSGWLSLDGSTYQREDYPELFDVLDTQFINTTAGTFTLPDLADYFLPGAGNLYALGATGGENTHVLTVAEMPTHNHTYVNPVANIDLEAPGAPDILAAGVGPGANTGNAGSDAAHENRPLYIAVNYAILAGR